MTDKPRPSATQRGLGAEHQRRRAQLLPLAYGTPCPMCGLVMLQGQALDLDHSIPRALGGKAGDRITHAKCNRAAGGRLRAALARARRQPPARQANSRRW